MPHKTFTIQNENEFRHGAHKNKNQKETRKIKMKDSDARMRRMK